MPTSGVDIIEHLKPFLNLAPRMKRVYKKAVEDRRGTFTTLFFQLMDYCIKTFSSTWLSNKWDKVYSATNSFCYGSSCDFVPKGHAPKWRSGLGFDDSAPLTSKVVYL